MSAPGSTIRSALRHPSHEHDASALGSSSTDAPTSAEKEPLALQQLQEMKAEAEERMISLNKQIDRAMQGRFPKHATLSSRTEVENLEEDPAVSEDMQKELSIESRHSTVSQSKVVSFTPSLEEELGDDGDAVTEPLLQREKRAAHTAQYLATLNAERTHGELMRKLNRDQTSSGLSDAESSEVEMGKRSTIHRQGSIARSISMSLRIFGLALAFITMVLLWEFADDVTALMFPNEEEVLIGYLVLAVLAAGCLALSQEWVNKAAEDGEMSSLPASFAYALSTLYMAIGLWGVIRAAVNVLVLRKQHIFVYGAGGLISLIGTIMYGLQTKHNVLLDIASCSTSMGLHDDDVP